MFTPPKDATLFSPSRRFFMLGLLGLSVSACSSGDNSVDFIGNASNGSVSVNFIDSVAVIDEVNRRISILFLDFKLSDVQRKEYVSTRSAFSLSTVGRRMLELKLEMKVKPIGIDEETLVPGLIRATDIVFWNFDSPDPVVRFEPEGGWAAESSMQFSNINGKPRKGGWVVGDVRGQKVIRAATGVKSSYTWNISIQNTVF